MRGETLILVTLLASSVALAHPRGIHKRDEVTFTARDITVLVAMDIDSGERAQLLRAGADRDADGKLSAGELVELRAQLVRLALHDLSVDVSSYPLVLAQDEAKISIREDPRASDTGISVAVLLHSDHPRVIPGMELRVRDFSPDGSPALVVVYQSAPDGGVGGKTEKELAQGEVLRVRLGQL